MWSGSRKGRNGPNLACCLWPLSRLACPDSGGNAGPGGNPCGGSERVACEPGLWCEPPSGTCGQADLIGVCVDIHRRCHHIYHAVCGCDGVTYGNECRRQHESVPQAHVGKC